MQHVQTKSFKLATYQAGSQESERLALLLPGKLDTGAYAHLISHGKFLASKGYHAIAFDPPGTWESGGDISEYTMSNYLKAINELIQHYGSKDTLVIGHSRGGTMALLAGTTNDTVVAFGSIMGRYTCDPLIKKQYPDANREQQGFKVQQRDLPPLGGLPKKEFHLPYSFLEDEIQYTIHESLRVCEKPKFFVAGMQDSMVTPAIVREGFTLSAGPKGFYELDFHHDYRVDDDMIDAVNGIIEDFLEKIE